jgi:hypothetical protein
MLARRVATIVGVFLLIEGAWGLVSPVVFGVLTTNTLHACIHIILGLAGLWMGRGDMARGYLTFVGGLLLLVGILWFIPIVSEIVSSVLAVTSAVAWVNIVVGIACLAVAAMGREKETVVV